MFFIHNPTIVIDSQNNESLFGSVLLASAFTGTHERAIRFCVKNKTVCKNGYKYKKYRRNSQPNY